MAGSFIKDLEYLGKVLLLTFLVLSCIVIYKQHVIEGIILITFCFQIILLWLMVQRYSFPENIGINNLTTKSKQTIKYLHIIGCFFLFIVAIIFLFRALVIVQHSVINYGSIKNNLYPDIYFAVIIGSIILVIFFILISYGNKLLKKNRLDVIAATFISGFSIFMLNNHIFHNF